ncbi:MAG: transposase [Elusimicrobia bacterium]|nr:transposase [Candidatus Liberimonas magnetica]
MTYRRFTKEQKQQIVEEALSGEMSKTAVARKHTISPTLLTRWIDAHQRGRFNNTPVNEAGYQEKIARLEQMVGRQAMEIEFLKKAQEYARQLQKTKERLSKSTNTSLKQREGGAN